MDMKLCILINYKLKICYGPWALNVVNMNIWVFRGGDPSHLAPFPGHNHYRPFTIFFHEV
jgi:hypothetical protein